MKWPNLLLSWVNHWVNRSGQSKTVWFLQFSNREATCVQRKIKPHHQHQRKCRLYRPIGWISNRREKSAANRLLRPQPAIRATNSGSSCLLVLPSPGSPSRPKNIRLWKKATAAARQLFPYNSLSIQSNEWRITNQPNHCHSFYWLHAP